jgi:uncharacterized LabA/DUF88 family protein
MAPGSRLAHNQGSCPVRGIFLEKRMIRTAILVDGGFYRKRAAAVWGPKNPEDRAWELVKYCSLHLKESYDNDKHHLYRILYYDCPPITKQIYHPLLKKTIDFSKSSIFSWNNEFFNQLKRKRKVALRFGTLSENWIFFSLNNDVTKHIFNGTKQLSDITERDFNLSVRQKGVDMKIGIDITSIALKKLADQIVLVAGDSDFVPVAKLARREGLDFILDPLWASITPSLFEHIDGLRSFRHIPNKNAP